MEHLEIPSKPYGQFKVPFLGEMYETGVVDFRDYPKKKGWDLERDCAAMEKYRHLGETYRDMEILHAVEFLENPLNISVDMSGEERNILRYGITILDDVLATIADGPWIANTTLNTGADILDQAIEQARHTERTRKDLVDAMRKRRFLDLLAVFTNHSFSEDKTEFTVSRQRAVALLVDCDKYQWHL